MRVALLTTNLQPNNGWATVTVRRGAALKALGVEVVVLTRRGDAPPEGIAPDDVRPILPPITKGGQSTLAILAANPAIARATADCDLIDVVAEPYASGCLLAMKHRPLVITACGTYVPLASTRGIGRSFYRAFFRRTPISAISEYTARRVAGALGGPLPRVILCGVDYVFYQPERPRPEKHGPTVLAVGAVKKRKGIHTLVDAMARVRQSIPDAQCVVAGKIAERGYVHMLREKITSLGLEGHVHLAGHLPYEEIVGWYQTADVFVLPSVSGPSHFEGFGLVILEANACGLPAIGSRDSGNESAIKEGVTGYLVGQQDVDTLADRIGEVLADGDLRARLGEAARQFAREHSWERSAREILSFYEDVLTRHSREAR